MNDVILLKDEFERRNGYWIRRRLTKHRRTGQLVQSVRLATAEEARIAEYRRADTDGMNQG